MFVFFEKDLGKLPVLKGEYLETVGFSLFLANNLVCGLWQSPQ